MPTVRYDADTTMYEAKLSRISNATQQVGNAIEQKRMSILSVYSHLTALSNIILHQIEKQMRGTEAAASAQVALNIIQVGTTGASIAQTIALANTYAATGNVGVAAFLYAQAGAMGYNLVEQQIQKYEAQTTQRQIKAMRGAMESWR